MNHRFRGTFSRTSLLVIMPFSGGCESLRRCAYWVGSTSLATMVRSRVSVEWV